MLWKEWSLQKAEGRGKRENAYDGGISLEVTDIKDDPLNIEAGGIKGKDKESLILVLAGSRSVEFRSTENIIDTLESSVNNGGWKQFFYQRLQDITFLNRANQ